MLENDGEAIIIQYLSLFGPKKVKKKEGNKLKTQVATLF